jgi:drug/metabolite transporter (DMT)-like permease
MKTGAVLLLTAEFLFALSTVFVKFVTSGTTISGIEIAFFRFLTGFILTFTYIQTSGKYHPMVKPFNVYMRGLFNTTSVIFFFLGVQYTTVSNTNLLNMTYPVFVSDITIYHKRKDSPGSVILSDSCTGRNLFCSNTRREQPRFCE